MKQFKRQMAFENDINAFPKLLMDDVKIENEENDSMTLKWVTTFLRWRYV